MLVSTGKPWVRFLSDLLRLQLPFVMVDIVVVVVAAVLACSSSRRAGDGEGDGSRTVSTSK